VARRARPVVLLACVTGWLALPTAVAPALLSTACTGNDCEGDVQTFPKCGGELAGGDPDVWESGPITGTYLDYHGERTWLFDPSGWMGSRVPINVFAYPSFAPNANEDGGFATASGNLAEYWVEEVGDGYQIKVLNDTCAQYYLRVVVEYAPYPAGTTPPKSACAPTAGDAGGGRS